jgi:hypothetical protein
MRRRELIRNLLKILQLCFTVRPLFVLTFIKSVNLFKGQASEAYSLSKNAKKRLKDFVSDKDFNTLQEAFNKAPFLGKQLRLQPKKTYIISETIVTQLHDKDFSIDGQDATFIIKDSSKLISSVTFNNISAYTLIIIKSEVIDLSKAPSLMIQNLNIISYDVQPILGFSLEGFYKNLQVENLNAKNLKHSAIWNRDNLYKKVGDNENGNSISTLENALIKNCTLEKCGAIQNAAIHINCPKSLVVDSCNFYDSSGYALRINGGALDTIPDHTNGSRNVLIKKCLFKNWVEKHIGLQVTKTYGVRIEANHFYNHPGNGTDNSIDIFNCQSVLISNNLILGSKGLFVGHADLNLTTTQNLVGTANVNIFNNSIFNTLSAANLHKTKMSPSRVDWGSITIGGDGTLEGSKRSSNIIIKSNKIINNIGISDQSAIHTFICQKVLVENNYIQGLATFYSEYYSKYVFVRNNSIRDVPVLLEMLGEDWITIPTHEYCGNTLLGTTQTASKMGSIKKAC